MTTMSVARIAETLQRDFRSAAGQLRQTGRRLRTTSRHYIDAADILDHGLRPSTTSVRICLSPTTNSLWELRTATGTPNCLDRLRLREPPKPQANTFAPI